MLNPLSCMKRPHLHFPKFDLHSLGFQTGIELAAGGLATAMLLRWMSM